MFSVGLLPFEVSRMLPLTPPVATGTNCTEKEVLCPALRVSGNARPLRLNPEPLAEAAEIVRLEPPELVSVSDSVFELPTSTFPKLKLVGFGVSWPGVTPVPERPMFNGEPGASETIARVPFAAPPTVGEKVTVNAMLCPAPSVAGSVRPLTE
jgi:hypothetical protein